MANQSPMSWLLFMCLAQILQPATALSTFTPNCTFPPEGANFVRGTDVRSTLDILWGCLSIILLCTYNILHLNVPRLRPEAGFWRKFWWASLDLGPKIKWMVVAVLVPELILVKAVDELAAARMWGMDCAEEERKRVTRRYLANMGYFVIDLGEVEELQDSGYRWKEPQRLSRVDMIRNAVEAESGNMMSTSDRLNLQRFNGRYWALSYAQWVHIKDWQLAELPDIPENHLEKVGAAGGLVKVLATAQICWLLIQMIVRKAQGLPSSQLEVATLAFAAQSIVTYACYWSRPAEVEALHVVQAGSWPNENAPTHLELSEMVRKLANVGPRYFGLANASYAGPGVGPSPIPNHGIFSLRNTAVGPGKTKIRVSAMIVSLSGVLFGGLHCLAWNSKFPTEIEQRIWRVCSITTTVLPLTSVVAVGAWEGANHYRECISRKLSKDPPPWTSGWIRYWPTRGANIWKARVKRATALLAATYVLARLFLVVGMFRSLCYLDPEVYNDTWPQEVPHFG